MDRVLQRRRQLENLRNRINDNESDSSVDGEIGADRNQEGDDIPYESQESSSSSQSSDDGDEFMDEDEVPYEEEMDIGSDNEGNENEENQNVENENEDVDDEAFLKDILQRWAADGGAASMNKLNVLLRNLAVRFPTIPLSYKTLLKTPRRVPVTPLNNNSILWYKGIRATLNAMDMQEYLQRYGKVELDINMDGLSLSKSSSLKFWPILGFLVGSENPPFVIAIYLGENDPDDIYAYLNDYIVEVDNLFHNGFSFSNVVYPFSIRNYILDAPARSLVKCCVQFNAYCSCEKCVTVGEWAGDRMVFPELDAAARSDESYENQDQPEHHEGRSPLEQIGTGMVSQFRLDPLHLIYIGVFKRLMVTAWMNWHGNFRLHWTAINAISDVLLSLEPTCPSDFNREIRPLDKIKYFKATEFRRICHYDSILIFRDNVNINIYNHFLLLYVALYILAHPVFVLLQEWRDYAHNLLVTFINHSVEIYGEEFIVNNVHALVHLVKECEEQNSTLHEFSAFKFESFLATLKRLLKTFYRPCQQAACRISEKLQFVQNVKLPSEQIEVHLSMEYVENNATLPGRHFRKISIGKYSLQLNERDQYFQTREGDVVKLTEIVEADGEVHLVGNIFQEKMDFFEYPLASSRLGIFSVSNLDDETVNFDLDSIIAKCWLMPDGDKFCCVPILHSCAQ